MAYYPYYYHVIICKSKLNTFLSNNYLSLKKTSKLWKNEHYHLIVQSEKLLQNTEGVQSEEILYFKNMNFKSHFFEGSEKEHDFFCNSSFTVSSLKNMCIATILKNLNYLHDMEKLKLPKPLFKNIFQQSKSKLRPIKYNELVFMENHHPRKIFDNFIQLDVIFHKKIVFWIKNFVFYNSRYEFERPFIVLFDFITPDSDSVQMCLKCMKYENEEGNYQRRYRLWKLVWRFKDLLFNQNPRNWCRACQQVPLFQVLNSTEYRKFYKYDIFETNYDWIDNKLLIKMDYFKNGEKIKSQYF